MFLSALETTVFYLPLLAIVALTINLWHEIETYLDISKLKFPKEMKAFGHAYTFAVRFASNTCSISIFTFTFVFTWNLADSFESSVISLLVFLVVFMVGGLIAAGISELTNEYLRDKSEITKLLMETNAQLTKTAPLLSDNEKNDFIQRKKREFWSDIKTNFWKYRIAKNN